MSIILTVFSFKRSIFSESHISAYVVRRETTEEGEEIPHHLYSIEFGTDLDGTQDNT